MRSEAGAAGETREKGRQQADRESVCGPTVSNDRRADLGGESQLSITFRKCHVDKDNEVAALKLENTKLKAEMKNLRDTVAALKAAAEQALCLNARGVRSAQHTVAKSGAGSPVSGVSSTTVQPGENCTDTWRQLRSDSRLAPFMARASACEQAHLGVSAQGSLSASSGSDRAIPLGQPAELWGSCGMNADALYVVADARPLSNSSAQSHDPRILADAPTSSFPSTKEGQDSCLGNTGSILEEMRAAPLRSRRAMPFSTVDGAAVRGASSGSGLSPRAHTPSLDNRKACDKSRPTRVKSGGKATAGRTPGGGTHASVKLPASSPELMQRTNSISQEGASLPTAQRSASSLAGQDSHEATGANELLPPTIIHFFRNLEDVSEEEKRSHVARCTFCEKPPLAEKPVGFCERCPRIFCVACLPTQWQIDERVHCPRCPSDTGFPPARGVEPMRYLLEQLVGHDLSHSFRDHPEYVKTAGLAYSMTNIGAMMEKLKRGKYSGRRAWGHFMEDCSQIWRNCRKFANCDEQGRPREGTVVPGVVRCALILEVMVSRFRLAHVSDGRGLLIEVFPGSLPEALQTWDSHRQLTLQENEAARLKQLAHKRKCAVDISPDGARENSASGIGWAVRRGENSSKVARHVLARDEPRKAICTRAKGVRQSGDKERLVQSFERSRSRIVSRGVRVPGYQGEGLRLPSAARNGQAARKKTRCQSEGVPQRGGEAEAAGGLSPTNTWRRLTREVPHPRDEGTGLGQPPEAAPIAAAVDGGPEEVVHLGGERLVLSLPITLTPLDQLCDVASKLAKGH